MPAASAANRKEALIEATGSTPRPTPGRSSVLPNFVHAVSDQPPPVSNDRLARATIGVPIATVVATATATTSSRSRPRRG
jgi:hypothetical protein